MTLLYEPVHGISNNVVYATSNASDQPAQYAQSDQSLCLSLEFSMSVKLLTEHHLEFLSLKGGCTAVLVWVYTFRNATLLEIT